MQASSATRQLPSRLLAWQRSPFAGGGAEFDCDLQEHTTEDTECQLLHMPLQLAGQKSR